MVGAAGEPPQKREEWGDYRENGAKGDSCVEMRSSDSEWHRNIALAATIQQYAGLVGWGHRDKWPCFLFWSADAEFRQVTGGARTWSTDREECESPSQAVTLSFCHTND